jgi:hypothetical protein
VICTIGARVRSTQVGTRFLIYVTSARSGVRLLLFDHPELDGLLFGWSANPNGSNDGWRALVYGVREFARGFEAEFVMWVRAEHIRQR